MDQIQRPKNPHLFRNFFKMSIEIVPHIFLEGAYDVHMTYIKYAPCFFGGI